jgi:ABC-type uncharacterized transport system permease subunit
MTEQIALLTDIFVRATPLILTGLAVSLAFKTGILNIGAEGQLLAGATAAAAIGVLLGPSLGFITIPIALILGAIMGGVWSAIAAYLRARFNVLEVISTIMLNFIALYGVSYVVRGPLQESTHIYPQTEVISTAARLPRLISGTRLHWGFLLALLIAVTLWWVIRYTAVGFRIRATGANAHAARSAGLIDTARVTFTTFIVSGMLAGLAGAIEVSGVTFALYENISPGYGYTAIAVALLAGLNPLGVIATGILFGALEAGANALQRDANIPSTLASVIEAAIILFVIAISQIRLRRKSTGSMFAFGRGEQ